MFYILFETKKKLTCIFSCTSVSREREKQNMDLIFLSYDS